MKKLIITTLCFTLFLTISYSQKLRTINPQSKAIDYSQIKVKNIYKDGFPKQSQQMAVNFSDYANLNSSVLNRTKFSIKHMDGERISWIEGEIPQEKNSSWDDKVNVWINAVSPVLGINEKTSEYKIHSITSDDIGMDHIKIHQYHNGIKVYNGELILHAKDGIIKSQNGYYVKTETLPSEKSNIKELATIKTDLKSSLKNFKEDWNVLNGLDLKLEADQWKEELVYFENEGNYLLGYYIEVYPNMAEHFTYLVDGKNGKVVKEFSTICKAHSHKNCSHNHNHKHITSKLSEEKEITKAFFDGTATANARDLLDQNRIINTYDVGGDFFMIDASRNMFNSSSSNMPNDPQGVIWTIDMRNDSPINNADYFHVFSDNNTWSNSPEGVSAHYNAGRAFDYFQNIHSRNSISGNGQNIISFVNVSNEDGTSMGNAFWNGLGIYYGNGDNQFLPLGRGLDVAGHEISHGVVQSTANLEYYGESGALNESFADIFGAMIDRDDWEMGEDVLRNGKPLRDLQNPHNGAQTGDFGGGWQPDHYNERYTGSQDNGGVHINSGITNHAYYLFATSTNKAIAEQIYYKALTNYLTRSSNFTDCRNAVVQCAQELYPNDSSIASKAASAFDQVGITGQGVTGNNQQDIELNPGDDILMFTDPEQSNLFVINLSQGTVVFDPLTQTDIQSRPSVTDDGSVMVFIGADRRAYVIQIDWSVSPPQATESVLIQEAIWDNMVISKDGTRLAATFDLLSPEDNIRNRTIWVYDLINDVQQEYELYSPTYSEGISTGNVLYPDAIEFDVTGNTVMYDALNRVNGSTGGDIEFWDIGFLEIWNQDSNTWALGKIEKLFGSLPEGISVGNPTFSKNSPFIIALDYIEEGNNQILGVNIETNDIGSIFENVGLGYPTYSRDDREMIHDLNLFGVTQLGILELNDSKITTVPNSENFVFQNDFPSKWGVWFSNGQRDLTSLEEIVNDEVELILSPNPAQDFLEIELLNDNLDNALNLEILDINGKLIYTQAISKSELKSKYRLPLAGIAIGSYVLMIRSKTQVLTQKFIKQ